MISSFPVHPETSAVLAGLLALLPALLLGVYLPNLPAEAHTRRRNCLLLQTVDLTGYLQVVVESSQGDVEILRRHRRRSQRPITDGPAVMTAALADLDQHRGGCSGDAGGAGNRLIAADCDLHNADAQYAPTGGPWPHCWRHSATSASTPGLRHANSECIELLIDISAASFALLRATRFVGDEQCVQQNEAALEYYHAGPALVRRIRQLLAHQPQLREEHAACACLLNQLRAARAGRQRRADVVRRAAAGRTAGAWSV